MTDKTPDSESHNSDETQTESTQKTEKIDEPGTVAGLDSATEHSVTKNADEDAITEAKKEVITEEKKEETKKEKAAPKATQEKSRGGLWRFFIVLLFIVILVVGTAGFFWFWVNEKFADIKSTQEQHTQSYASSLEVSSVQEIQSAFERQLEQLKNKNQDLSKQVGELSDRVQSHNLRLLAMSTTSRDDWLLAEAEYLLKLANQRVLIERSAETATGLLEEADAILRDLSNPDLFELRKAIKEDIVKLKLVEEIDAEGIYLELAALSERVHDLPLVPQSYNYQSASESDSAEDKESDSSTFKKFVDSFSSYVRVIRHEKKPEAILPPDQTAYLHMNLRFMLERAQIALLREQQNIYEKNIQQARTWVENYFPNSSAAEEYSQLLSELGNKNIVSNLPDISTSLDMLHEYISMLHKLGTSNEEAQLSLPEVESKEAL